MASVALSAIGRDESTSFPNHVVEMALAHSIRGVEAAYRLGDLLDKRRKLMEAWAGYLGTPTEAKVLRYARA